MLPKLTPLKRSSTGNTSEVLLSPYVVDFQIQHLVLSTVSLQIMHSNNILAKKRSQEYFDNLDIAISILPLQTGAQQVNALRRLKHGFIFWKIVSYKISHLHATLRATNYLQLDVMY